MTFDPALPLPQLLSRLVAGWYQSVGFLSANDLVSMRALHIWILGDCLPYQVSMYSMCLLMETGRPMQLWRLCKVRSPAGSPQRRIQGRESGGMESRGGYRDGSLGDVDRAAHAALAALQGERVTGRVTAGADIGTEVWGMESRGGYRDESLGVTARPMQLWRLCKVSGSPAGSPQGRIQGRESGGGGGGDCKLPMPIHTALPSALKRIQVVSGRQRWKQYELISVRRLAIFALRMYNWAAPVSSVAEMLTLCPVVQLL